MTRTHENRQNTFDVEKQVDITRGTVLISHAETVYIVLDAVDSRGTVPTGQAMYRLLKPDGTICRYERETLNMFIDLNIWTKA